MVKVNFSFVGEGHPPASPRHDAGYKVMALFHELEPEIGTGAALDALFSAYISLLSARGYDPAIVKGRLIEVAEDLPRHFAQMRFLANEAEAAGNG